ncbi:formimidoylglutamase [Winogradskyella litorisediminis]|uniref:Formimidoylglutamase n=1 Tax=Winogradskyella litorisediminis TaxID=1156618 RepID=A0ABW3N246_9FLAO
MHNLKLLTSKKRDAIVAMRKGETKFGERIRLIDNLTNIYENISSLDVDYVIFGISEDIGVYANHGKPGTYRAFEAAIKVLLNTQTNAFIEAEKILVLGNLNYSEKQKELRKSSLSEKEKIDLARKMVEAIDKDVTYLVHNIIKAGKKPIIIGGGHNNAYGNIKGSSLALNKTLNVINFDAHHDFRMLEGRHSGNGFNYAHHEGFLQNYFIFGLHENYISQNSLETLNTTEGVNFNTFEALEIRKELKFKSEIKKALKHISDSEFGIEIDCDAIKNIPSSAKTPSGFSVTKTRRFIHAFGSHKNATYLHICEAVPKKKTETQVGKLISYLITDFLKAHANRNS